MLKRLRNEAHHWWPKSLSRFWVDDEGRVHQVTPDGTVTPSLPSNFGKIKNAHHIKIASESPWNTTFEPDFGKADAQFGDVIGWLASLESKTGHAEMDYGERLMPQPMPPTWRTKIAECLASLIVRSPSTRHRIAATVESYSFGPGLAAPKAGKTLIALNMRDLYAAYARSIGMGGKFLVLFSNSTEFIFGDGFLHNFSVPAMPLSNARCIVPLTPSLTVIYTRPMSYPTHPELVTLRLDPEEVDYFNSIIQVYSGERLFYRSQAPRLTGAFMDGKFYQFDHHRDARLDHLLNAYVMFSPDRRRLASTSYLS